MAKVKARLLRQRGRRGPKRPVAVGGKIVTAGSGAYYRAVAPYFGGQSESVAQDLKRIVAMDAEIGLAYVLSALSRYAKDHAPFTDRTGNLRASIGWRIERRGRSLVGIFYAGMEYAVHVEFKGGYWVLSGALHALKPVLAKVFGKGLKDAGARAVAGRGWRELPAELKAEAATYRARRRGRR